MIWILLFVVIVVPICWLISEFQSREWLRVALGCAAIGMSYFVAYVVGSFARLGYNAWYGEASEDLVKTVIVSIEAGNEEKLLGELKRLQDKYQPTYENRAHYDELVNEFVERMGEPHAKAKPEAKDESPSG